VALGLFSPVVRHLAQRTSTAPRTMVLLWTPPMKHSSASTGIFATDGRAQVGPCREACAGSGMRFRSVSGQVGVELQGRLPGVWVSSGTRPRTRLKAVWVDASRCRWVSEVFFLHWRQVAQRMSGRKRMAHRQPAFCSRQTRLASAWLRDTWRRLDRGKYLLKFGRFSGKPRGHR